VLEHGLTSVKGSSFVHLEGTLRGQSDKFMLTIYCFFKQYAIFFVFLLLNIGYSTVLLLDTVRDAIGNLGLIGFEMEMKRQARLLQSSVSSHIK